MMGIEVRAPPNDSYTGDQFRLNGTNISNAINPSNDVFNSTISSLGAHVTTKNPNYINQLGYDADIFSANGILANGSTSATLTVTTGGEVILPGVITSAINLYTPVVNVNKTLNDLNGDPAEIGDILEYTVVVRNNRDANGMAIQRIITFLSILFLPIQLMFPIA
ncbi:MAG: hypothetical protein HC784_01695 [Hydrococcus sp. CSU_1_8]|nr:hypothetical protein [Hydrococcus sp. CSU_1_8]